LLLIFWKLHYDLKEIKRPVWGSVGGLYKRFATPAALPLPDFWMSMAQIYYSAVGYKKNHFFSFFCLISLKSEFP
jgi:hypothetical protein